MVIDHHQQNWSAKNISAVREGFFPVFELNLTLVFDLKCGLLRARKDPLPVLLHIHNNPAVGIRPVEGLV